MRHTVCMLLIMTSPLIARSIYRMSSRDLPRITTRWSDEERTYTLQHPNLEVGPIFTNYDPEYLAQHYFPEEWILARHHTPDSMPIEGAQIIRILEAFVAELQSSTSLRAHYRDVIVIKKKGL